MQTNTSRRSLKDVIGSVRNADGRVVVLIGAGCSKSAGIPLASGLIEEIRSHYPEAYARAQGKNSSHVGYNAAMGELSLVDRRKLLGGHIEKARINWAHLALAQLLKHQKIERVLSVNFDNLLIQACGATGFYPPVYDLAATDRYSDKWVTKQSLLYLNGQHAGFVTLNAEAELKKHETKLEAVVKGTGTQAVWLVIGYSGEADPLLHVLAKQELFEGDLYWLGHSKDPSEGLLQSGLFAEGKSAFYVGDQDADQALTQLAQKLGCFPPEILTKPFEHIAQVVERIDFDTGGDAAKALQVKLHNRLEQAKEAESPSTSEQTQTPNLADVENWILAGQLTQVQKWYFALTHPTDEQRDLGSWAYVMEGNALDDEAQAMTEQNLLGARELWKQAGEKYAQALAIKTDIHEAAYNWGNALAKEAKTLIEQDAANNLEAARRLWKEAGEKYALALQIAEDEYEAATNWGLALDDEAKALITAHADKNMDVARSLWKEAGEKFLLALEMQQGEHLAAYNWGSALAAEAHALLKQDATENLVVARSLWKTAGMKYRQALEINPNEHEAAIDWAFALLQEVQAIQADEPLEAQALLKEGQGLLERQSALSEEGAKAVAYNLACIYALQSKVTESLQHLEICRLGGSLPDPEYLLKEKDLDLIRPSSEFQAWWHNHFDHPDSAHAS